MHKYTIFLIAFLLLIQVQACKESKDQLIKIDAVSPWCIIGFDSQDRSPIQRITMLEDLGLSKYGYNRGKGKFDNMKEEFTLAKEHNIEMTSIFLWLNADRDTIGRLSESNRTLIDNVRELNQKPAMWVSFSDNFFKNLDDKESVTLSVNMINSIIPIADDLGCKLSLYNHNGWFGNPMNQLKVLEKLDDTSIGMVYNFHHAQDYVDDFRAIAHGIAPYLSFVNLNGVRKEGPQILPIGEGDHEYEMIKVLKNEGFNGPWGILGHIKTEDVKVVLEKNIAGLELLNAKYSREL